MGRSAIPGTGTGGLLLPTLPRIVTTCSTIVAMVSSTAVAATTVTAGAVSAASGRSAYNIPEFCQTNKLSMALFHNSIATEGHKGQVAVRQIWPLQKAE